jgi:hypothetical protein
MASGAVFEWFFSLFEATAFSSLEEENALFF